MRRAGMERAHRWMVAALLAGLLLAPAAASAQDDAPAATVAATESAEGAQPPSSAKPAPPSSEADDAAPPAPDDVDDDVFLHGFRLGYLFMMNIDRPYDPEDPGSESFAQHHDMRSAHQFLIGYEITVRMIGHDWLNVLLVSNFLIGGLEQSKFFPSFNGLLGFEFDESFQLGLGASITPTRDRPAHMLVAAGWTPKVGRFYLPVHFFFVPDVNAHHRLGATIGVNW